MLQKPQSMSECIYYTIRDIGNGEATAWVLKELCPKCGKVKMGKPVDDKGKVKIRAKEYVCPQCGYSAEKKEYEETLTASIEYTCPKCGNKGETQIPFKRKKFEGVDALRFTCGKCGEKIDIAKKFKTKKGDAADDD